MDPKPAHVVGESRCERCRSQNVEFRYYNNKNPTQPRYFCFDCRKFYTHGGKTRESKAIPVRKAARLKRRRLEINTDDTNDSEHDSEYNVEAKPPSQGTGSTSRTFRKITSKHSFRKITSKRSFRKITSKHSFRKITFKHPVDPSTSQDQRAYSEEHESGGPASLQPQQEHSIPASSSAGVEIQQDDAPWELAGPVNVATQGCTGTAEEVERNPFTGIYAECPEDNGKVALQNECSICNLMSITEVEAVKFDDPADLVFRFRFHCTSCGQVFDDAQVRWDPQGIPGVSVLTGDALSQPPNPPPKTSPPCPRCFEMPMAFAYLKKYSRQETRTQCEVCPRHKLEPGY